VHLTVPAGLRTLQAGKMAGWLQFVSSGVDACIYPGLFLVYLEQVHHICTVYLKQVQHRFRV
jgi:hypothetical protein